MLSGERHYLKDLEDLTAFIVPYLKAMGVDDATLPSGSGQGE